MRCVSCAHVRYVVCVRVPCALISPMLQEQRQFPIKDVCCTLALRSCDIFTTISMG
jgi:hypothetical protein